jgi:hypothetical protein
VKYRNLGFFCLLVVLGIFAAGLWPFTPYPRNDISWSANGEGLAFGDYATVLSDGLFRAPSADRDCALEVWFVPGLTYDSNTILAFSEPQNFVRFRVGQNGRTLFLARTFRSSSSSQEQTNWMAIRDVFIRGRPVFLAVSTSPSSTVVYIDGVKADADPDFGLVGEDFSGTLVVANSPIGNNSWSGLLKGIAVYYSALSPEQVFKHYTDWRIGNATDLTSQGAAGLYLFQGIGNRISNEGAGKQPDLFVPNHYLVLHPSFLEPFWKTFSFTVAYWEDVSTNILAFIPLGFLLSAYLSKERPGGHWFRNTVLIGAVISLTIECLQYFLPMRDSDSTDFITNLGGTVLGAFVYNFEMKHGFVARIPVLGRIWEKLATEGPLHAGNKANEDLEVGDNVYQTKV